MFLNFFSLVEIKKAAFITSSPTIELCPPPKKPEYAFIGRSNVGKSSLINMLCNKKSLAKTSATPGKTQLINHFLINDAWYLVDLPGYGWARVSKTTKEEWNTSLRNYLSKRENLINVFVLIDIRHDAQKNDIAFMNWLGEQGIPFSIIFTKSDKLKPKQIDTKVKAYEQSMLEFWEEMPLYFVTSSLHKSGKDQVLSYVQQLNQTCF